MATRTAAQRRQFAQQVADLLTAAQRDGIPVHVGTSRSQHVNVGYLVRTVPADLTGRAELVRASTLERFTPALTEISLVVTVDGRCVSRPAGGARRLGRRDAVATALLGLAGLLGMPDLDDAERATLEGLVGQVAALSA